MLIEGPPAELLDSLAAGEFRRPPIGEDVGRFLAIFQEFGVFFEQEGQVLVGRLKSRLGLGEPRRSGQDVGDSVLGTGGGPSRLGGRRGSGGASARRWSGP